MGKVIVIISGKGGTGKTTTAAALSSALAQLGQTVLCLDADIGLKNLDLSLGLADVNLADFCEVTSGRLPLERAVYPHPDFPSLFVLSAPTLASPEDLTHDAMRALLGQARERYDFVLVDSPAGIGSGFRLAACAADAAVVVTTADLSSCRDAQRVVMELAETELEDVSLIVSRVRPRLFFPSKINVDDIMDTAGARLLGLVPEDRAVIVAANTGVPLLKYSQNIRRGASAAYIRIAARLLGGPAPLGAIRTAL